MTNIKQGALTFFPPEPALYKFQRVDKHGNELPDEDDENNNDEDPELNNVHDDDDSELGTFEIDTSSARNNTQRQRQKQQQPTTQQRQQSQDPIAAMTERSTRLRARAKHRAVIDASDATNGITYNFIPNTEILGPLPSFHGSISAVKIGPQKKTGSYIAALLYKLPQGEILSSTKTILYSHGNATDVGAMSGLQAIIAKHVKCNVLVYDYSGYGESGGVPMEKNTYRDIKLVYEWVVKNVTQHESKIILYGQSVGSGPSCYLASRRENVGGLVLHSPFTSGMRVLTPSRALACLDIFPNIDRIKNVSCPVFIIHGKKDVEVPIEHGMALHSNVPEDCKRDPWWVENKGHNDICDGSEMIKEYVRRLEVFVSSLD